MAVDRSSNNQATSGSGMGTALATSEEERIKRQQELGEEASAGASSGPATIGGSSATQTSAPVKAMPKQQKAGTGSFANLKSYLQAAQGGGQQKIAQAATQQVQKLGAGAQKGVQQAQESFKGQLGAGSGAIFKGAQPGEFLSAEDVAKQSQATTGSVLGTAKGITYQVPQVTTQAEGEAPTQAPVPAQPQQYFKPEDLEAFSNIINAQYQGPVSLQQAGLYEQAARKARAAQQAGELTQTAGGREQLLRDVFGRGRDYSRGASRLDALLLNASEQGVQQLQQQAQPALQSQQALQAAQNLSANEAAQRAAAIQGISSGARTAFTEARAAEETAAQDYITNIQQNWDKLPKYFKDLLTETASTTSGRVGNVNIPGYYRNNQNKANIMYDREIAPSIKGTTYNLSPEEADILGFAPGEGLFGIDPNDIQASAMATGAELITKDQLSRQLALSKLAELDKLGNLKKQLNYTDLEKAGTKDLFSSIDRDRIEKIQAETRKQMEEAVANMGMRGVFQDGYQPLYFSDALSKGGYKSRDMEGLKAENYGTDLLRNIAEGKEYSPAETAQVKNYIQQAYENILNENKKKGVLTNLNQLRRWSLAPLAKKISTHGAFDTVQLAENDQTAARAQALRDLLAGIYKK